MPLTLIAVMPPASMLRSCWVSFQYMAKECTELTNIMSYRSQGQHACPLSLHFEKSKHARRTLFNVQDAEGTEQKSRGLVTSISKFTFAASLGVFGSMLGTPLIGSINSAAALGLHATKDRAVVLPNGEIGVRPIMYLALTYDHRLVDGREAVTFLCMIRDQVEDPRRCFLEPRIFS
ncbi:Dihydrolipoyllysine-residue succinyltransferase component of 2-oxoglutarate dehydrogenase complex, mitochondrial [Symbiodinium microadriaticum]|uniref:dihydrolipoyllysine-residue succinyltransferase n=1 Tax=Symbiodinium microadriaticum TaxID=2951 RepID=A0A1Q9EXM3_SYMMI|nr:Dihydrolipoyllysine-residue succinyltransferase component of 2-oxoglutarate dehydrogenase complex, mitochondrial [Symbiodinium microadriaticum]